MKLMYEVPEMDVVTFEAEDVIATSGGGLNYGGEGSGESSDWPF